MARNIQLLKNIDTAEENFHSAKTPKESIPLHKELEKASKAEMEFRKKVIIGINNLPWSKVNDEARKLI